MKKYVILAALLCMSCWCASAQGPALAEYDPQSHTLSLKARNARLESLAEALSAQGVQLYFDGLPQGLTFDADLTDSPLDEALSRVIPEDVAYFYRVSPEAEAAMAKQAVSIPAMRPQPVQKSRQIAARAAARPRMAEPEAIISRPEAPQGQPEAARMAEERGNGPLMSTNRQELAAETRTARASSPRPVRNLAPGNKDKHLVVLFRVTENAIEPVSASLEPGAWQSSGEAAILGDYAVIGLEGDEVVLAEGMPDPLEARSIFDPAKGSHHGAFRQEEAYIAVKMPEKYAQKTSARKLSLQLERVGDLDRAALIQKVKARRQNATANSRPMEAPRVIENLDLSGITILNQE